MGRMIPIELTNMGVKLEDFFSPEIDSDYAKTRRIAFLESQVIELQAEIDAYKIEYQQEFEKDIPYNQRGVLYYLIQDKKQALNKAEREIAYQKSDPREQEDLSEKIAKAKRVPFHSIIELTRNKALCPFHDDHHPSFSVRHNKGHCFACGWHGDTIDFVKEKFNLTFYEAIKKLTDQDDS